MHCDVANQGEGDQLRHRFSKVLLVMPAPLQPRIIAHGVLYLELPMSCLPQSFHLPAFAFAVSSFAAQSLKCFGFCA